MKKYDMNNLTRDDAHDLCVEMWNLIAENNYEKDYALEIMLKKTDYRPLNDCWACVFYNDVEVGMFHESKCGYCPFKNHGDRPYACEVIDSSPYSQWEYAETDEERKKLAIEIADLFID